MVVVVAAMLMRRKIKMNNMSDKVADSGDDDSSHSRVDCSGSTDSNSCSRDMKKPKAIAITVMGMA